ncbi:MAG: flavin reductase family protein [Bacteroidetes bacterium]|nr:flavin reductase family protein [Bacteroidota bacterium]
MTRSFLASELDNSRLYAYLSSAVAPRPIAFASTIDAHGNPNLSPFSFFNVFSSSPPILVFSPVNRGQDGSQKDTLLNVQEVPEVVINVVNYEMVQQMSLSSTAYPKGINEFVKSGFSAQPSDLVKPFRVAESPVQFECKVTQILPLGQGGGAGNLVVCEVVKIHIKENLIDTNGHLKHQQLDLVSRMGANWYCRASHAMFEVPKPLAAMGIGVDQIPKEIRHSHILTGNDLGKLATLEKIPDTVSAKQFVSSLKGFPQAANTENRHRLAQEYLDKNEIENAWKILLAN